MCPWCWQTSRWIRRVEELGLPTTAFRFPVDAIDTEFGLYFENIHSRTPIASGYASTNPQQLTAGQRGTLQAMGLVNDSPQNFTAEHRPRFDS